MTQEHESQHLPDRRSTADAHRPDQGAERPKHHLALYAVLGLFLIIASVVGTLLITQPQSVPENAASTAATPSVTPSEEPTSTLTPTPNQTPSDQPAPPGSNDAPPVQPSSAPPAKSEKALSFTSFQPSGAAVVCTDESQTYPITFSWQSQNAVSAWFGVDTANAKAAPLQEVPPSGSITWDFFCSNPSTTYTVTIADTSGTLAHRSVMVERK